ncbi:uncharacterized protein GIQ15_01649 [Arthroderma uncinatum]|uniref:uncharacterized protein n=1 Tax=Arthroderma uncinatum TaxID=74035 RepID=UPI00144A7DC6|nr:uncharacterized protein GIQ15_01649 [Arthroderma uncinatum]KAF3492132.1 hypothetical protein GIQ15_01649 [Arthroderma uncinatum]
MWAGKLPCVDIKSDGDCLYVNDVKHVKKIYKVYSDDALIKVQTKLGKEKLGLCSLEELRRMPGVKTAVAMGGINIPPDFEASIWPYETYSREAINDSTAVDQVEIYEGIEHVKGSYFVWAVISRGGKRVKVIFKSIHEYLLCEQALAVIPNRDRDTFEQYRKMEESGPRQPPRVKASESYNDWSLD